MVLVYRIDRLARNTMHFLNVFDKLDKLGITLRSMTEPFDTSTPAGRFTMTMFASIATLERDTILERTSLGKDRAARNGKWTGGKPPYGYKVNSEGFLEIDEKQAKIVRLIFHLYTVEGMGTIPIADYLNAKQVPTPYQAKGTNVITSGKWNAGLISRILNNTTYKGIHEYRKENKTKKERIIREVPTIVSEELWNRTQALLRKNFVMASRNARRQYLLRGLIRCGLCGRTFVGDGNNKKGRFYYRCTGNSSFRGKTEPKCGAIVVRAELIEEIVWNDVKRFVKNPGWVVNALKEKLQGQIENARPLEEEIAEIEKALVAKQEERARVINLVRKGLISEQEAEAELLAAAKEIEALNTRKESLLERQLQLDSFKAKAASARAILEQLQEKVDVADFKTRRELVEALVESIRVDIVQENGRKLPRITIIYCFGNPDSSEQSSV
ncbi:MAG: recombinase family protein [Bacillota bacterium]|nr:recombinase family protein [Bacillota bacterium]